MADIELVIKILDTIYNNIIDIPESSMFSIDCDSRIRRAIQNGTPLPKGHGRLFDETDIVNGNYKVIGHKIYELEPIIEADKEDEDADSY